jgi:methylthioribose-1-phosphate isomerase
MMARGEVDLVVTGADRIAANGDAATRSAPTRWRCSPRTTASRSTSSPRARPSIHGTATGADIPIEERDGAEVTARFPARNPAFDVTPAALIAAIVTEEGVHRAPYAESLP